MQWLILIVHNVRSTHNVGSLLRTADGLGVDEVWLTGYTPYPLGPDDSRLPHIAQRLDRQIHKTALGAEASVGWHQAADIFPVLDTLRSQGCVIAALEQTETALSLPDFRPPAKLALIVGREVEGLEADVLTNVDLALQIPMLGAKESYNVAQAAAMALYHCRFKR